MTVWDGGMCTYQALAKFFFENFSKMFILTQNIKKCEKKFFVTRGDILHITLLAQGKFLIQKIGLIFLNRMF